MQCAGDEFGLSRSARPQQNPRFARNDHREDRVIGSRVHEVTGVGFNRRLLPYNDYGTR